MHIRVKTLRAVGTEIAKAFAQCSKMQAGVNIYH